MKRLNFIIVSLMFVASFVYRPVLPEMLPTHWNIRGQIDSYMPKGVAIWMMPAIALLSFLGFYFLPMIDPKKEKYKLFKNEWAIIKTALIGFFAYMQFLTFYIAINPGTNMMPLMFMGLGVLFILLGNYLSKIRQNYFIGFKLPWTLASEDNWNKTHRFASWCYVIAGIITLIEAYFIWYAPVVVFASLILASILPAVYSFLLFKKKAGMMKFIYIGLLVVFLGIFMIRLLAGEDGWICSEGRWIKHGAPSAPMPNSPCR